MKKNVIFVAIFAVLMICSCSKNKTATDSESRTSKIQFSDFNDYGYISVSDSVNASEIQEYLDFNKIDLSVYNNVSISLNKYIENDVIFEIDQEKPFLKYITDFANRNFSLVLNGYIFNNVENLSLQLYDYSAENLEKLPIYFPNINKIYLNDVLGETKMTDLSFLLGFKSLTMFEIITEQVDKEIYNKMISDFAENIYCGNVHTFGLVNIRGKLGYPMLFSGADIPQNLEYIPDWYTGKDISGIPAWCNTELMKIYETPSIESNVISKIDKNQYCTIKSIGVPDAMNGEVSVSVYFPYKDERTFMEDMKWNDIWFKIHTEDNNVGYVLGKHLRLSK